jgi:REP element-mobilizing transposase RayT
MSVLPGEHLLNYQPFHRRSVRLHGYDYTQDGAYFITIVAFARENIFGMLVDQTTQLTHTGEIAAQEWERLPRRFPALEVDEFIIMPNHLHGILVLADPHRGTGTAEAAQIESNAPRVPVLEHFGAPVKGSIPTILRSYKSSVTQRCQWLAGNEPVTIWQRNYYEHVIRDEDELNCIRQYIVDNPIQWSTDWENPAGSR